MNLEEALEKTDHHPSAPDRAQILKEHLSAFRKDFFGHVQILKRCKAWADAGNKEIMDGGKEHPIEEIKERSEKSLDSLHASIKIAQAELQEIQKDIRKVDPDSPADWPGAPTPSR